MLAVTTISSIQQLFLKSWAVAPTLLRLGIADSEVLSWRWGSATFTEVGEAISNGGDGVSTNSEGHMAKDRSGAQILESQG